MKKITVELNLSVILVFLLIGVLVFALYPPKAEAVLGIGDTSFVTILPNGAALEQLLKQEQSILGIFQQLDQMEQQTNQAMAFSRMFAAWTGNKKLIEIANSNPYTIAQNGISQWINEFSNNVTDTIASWFKDNTWNKTITEGDKDPQADKDANKSQETDSEWFFAGGDEEENLRKELVYRKNQFERLGNHIRYNYHNQILNQSNLTITEYEQAKYPNGTIPKFLSLHQKQINIIAEALKKNDSATNTMIAQQKITNALLMHSTQTNLEILQAINDLIKIEYYKAAIEHSNEIQNLYSKIRTFNDEED